MCVRVSFLVKFQTDVCNFIKKETPAEVLYEFCEIFKNTIFLEHLQAIASDEAGQFPFKQARCRIFGNFDKTLMIKNRFYQKNSSKNLTS